MKDVFFEERKNRTSWWLKRIDRIKNTAGDCLFSLLLNFGACTNFTKKSTLKPFHESKLARMIGYAIIALLILIVIVKLTGYDGGKIPWSNVYSTTFFALVYLFFVFFPWKRK